MDKVYYISKGTLKPANKTFSNLPNDYELTLNNDSVIQECVEDLSDIPTVKYDFVPINQIAEKPANTIVGESETNHDSINYRHKTIFFFVANSMHRI